MDTKIGSIDACNPINDDIGGPPNGGVSTVQNSNPLHSTTNSPCDATLGRYLARRLVEIGVTDVFAVPGDFNLTLLDHLVAEPNLKLIGCCNELNAGYAADGYARSRGVGACVVTFTVGGLSVLNAIAGAYSENLPLICIVGGPNSNDYGTNRILHHTIGLPDFTQELKCFQAITCYQAVINNLEEAHELIDTAISTALKESKPVYISISCNLPSIPLPAFSRHPVPFILAPKVSNQVGLDAAVEAAAEFLNKAVKPVLVGGPKMRVAKATDAFVELADASGYGVAVMPSAKGQVPEQHKHFIGTYWGAVSTAFCAEIVESADAYLFAGPIFNDYSSVGYSLLLKKEKAIIVQPDRVTIGNGPAFGWVLMKEFLSKLAKRIKHNNTSYENYHRIYVPGGKPLRDNPKEPLRVNVMFQHIQNMLSSETAVLAETGDSWFNCQKLKLPEGCGYEFQMQYGSIGWSVGATLGYAQAMPNKRVIACIGDGSFQVTAQDVSTMIRCGQKTIIFLINNGGYTIEVEIHDGPYNVIKNWNYTAFVEAIHNGEGKCWTAKVRCEEELVKAISTATNEEKESFCFIEVIVHKDDTSKELLEWGSRVSAANSRPPNPHLNPTGIEVDGLQIQSCCFLCFTRCILSLCERYAFSGVQFASSLSKISSASAPTLSALLLSNSIRSVRTFSALRSFRVCSIATRWSHGANWQASLRSQTRISAPMLEKFERKFASIASEHAYKNILTTLHKPDGGEYGKFYSLPALNDSRIDRLPYSVRILLESAIRNCDNFHITKDDVAKIMDWENTSSKKVEIPFKPARVILQDFTGVPVMVDLAAMRDAMKNLGSDPNKINPRVPVDLVFDHSLQVYGARKERDLRKGIQLESDKNSERFMFLKWGSSAFYNMVIASPVSRMVHQVDLEYLGRVVFNSDGFLYPDSVVGTYYNITMINGLGVAGWEVGGIEAEAAILGQPISVVLPSVVGFNLAGKLRVGVTITDLVPTVTEMLRKHGVFGNIVEFYGEGMSRLSLNDRAAIANMSTEYKATMGFFPVDHITLEYLKLKGRSNETVAMIETYLRANKMFVDYNEPQEERAYTSYLHLDLGDVEPRISGPKRPFDQSFLRDMKVDWKACLDNPLGMKGFAVPKEQQDKIVKFSYRGQPADLKHGSVVIATITSDSSISSPSDMVGAALVAKKAYDLGLEVKPWIRTSVAPVSGVVEECLLQSGLQKYLAKQGFNVVGYGVTTSIWGSDDLLDEPVESAVLENDIIAAAVSSSRGVYHRITCARAKYLTSPQLVVAYALSGTVNIDFEKEPIGTNKDGKNVYLRDIWPRSEEVTQAFQNSVLQSMFKSTYETMTEKNSVSLSSALYSWDSNSTYIQEPPFFKNMTTKAPGPREVKDAYCLMSFGDNITTIHISPAGTIREDSPAAKFLIDQYSMYHHDFNSYGSRRGNHEVMARGTFANTHIVNKLLNGEIGPKTVHIPTGEKICVFDAASRYKTAGQDTIILAGAEYGIGSTRDWAAKGPMLLGVRAIIAKSFNRVHRSNLASMGIVPLCFKSGEDAETLGLTGHERYTIHLPSSVNEIKPCQGITVTTDTAKSFVCTLRLDTEVELAYYNHGGMLSYIIRSLSNDD